ncbi:HD domain-containing protein [Lyticum sinuosum]|nr:HD domain-containing protein [Lyticum sinuosum]
MSNFKINSSNIVCDNINIPIIDPYHPDWINQFKNCEYANLLINKLKCLQKKEKNKNLNHYLILKAIFYAKFYHKDQKRKSGELYYVHALKVTEMVAHYILRTDLIITSILHDTVEDTQLTIEMISNAFGYDISNQILYLTRVYNQDKITAAQIVEYLLEDKYHDVLIIKLLDRIHNIMTLNTKGISNTAKTIQETLHAFLILSSYLGIKNAEEKITLMCLEYKNIYNNKKSS